MVKKKKKNKRLTQSTSKRKAKLKKKPNEKEVKLSPDEEQEIRNLLHQRSKIIAIKRIIDITGCELRTSINYIESFLIAHKDEFPSDLRHKEIIFASQIILDPSEKEEVLNLLNEKGIVEAIKKVREITGAGLKASKDYIDALRNKSHM